MLRSSLAGLRCRTAKTAASAVSESKEVPAKKKKRVVRKVKKVKTIKKQPIEEWKEHEQSSAVDLELESYDMHPTSLSFDKNVEDGYAYAPPADAEEVGALFPTIDPKYPSFPTDLIINQLDPLKRSNLQSLFTVSGIDGKWKDFGLINHLSTNKWVMETNRFNTLGMTIAKLALSKAIFNYTITKGVSWERHYAPVTFEVDKSDLTVNSPLHQGNRGLPSFDAAIDHLPDVSNKLSYLHVQQLEAVHLNEGNLSLLGADWGLEGLMHSDELPTIQDFTPAERMNPTLVIKPTDLLSAEQNLENTNLGPVNKTVGNEVGQKVLALIGSVKVEKNRSKATKVAEHIFRLNNESDLIDRTVDSLDNQIMELDPTSVMTNILLHMGIEVEYRTEVAETPLSPQEIADIEMSLEDAQQIADSAAIERQVLLKKGTEIQAIEERLEKAKWIKPNHEEEDNIAKQQAEDHIAEGDKLNEDGPIDPESVPKTDTSSELVKIPTDREIVHEDDEYTLQFDSEGNPIDIRQTSIKYPIEPGPHQVCFTSLYFPQVSEGSEN